MEPSDFPTDYKVKWVRAYPLVAGIPSADVQYATPAELDEGFGRVLRNLYLRGSHATFLEQVQR